ncbi:hypothetical protein C9I92_24840 [Photobacterium ganghwense]|uniref:Uncharacterized protein n=1 Tax=Photobacterium ganghwense TaxID=320778 RepID=A0A0J1H5N6_9GAMM|nr:hypothetical protein [Photobacterium ganghwense]KLV07028.1 hypothetical protein ABT57_17890 [Photobacterium ganghwense]PSU03651.1 hypothetical protein C9I92_24840 [Photobacterium ganghwense]
MAFTQLSGHRSYIYHIAIGNIDDYFFLVEQQDEKGNLGQVDMFKRMRYYLNAIESLNNISDYFYHEFKEKNGWSEKQDDKWYARKIRKKHPLIQDVANIANAYKHCVRNGKNAKLHASDLEQAVIKIDINDDVKVSVNYNPQIDDDLIEKAYHFWLDYLEANDNSILSI